MNEAWIEKASWWLSAFMICVIHGAFYLLTAIALLILTLCARHRAKANPDPSVQKRYRDYRLATIISCGIGLLLALGAVGMVWFTFLR